MAPGLNGSRIRSIDPSEIPLELWWSLRKGAYTDIAMTTRCVADGDNVRALRDLSGRGRHCLDSGGGPYKYRPQAMNGLPTLDSTGAGVTQLQATGFELSYPFTVFFVAEDLMQSAAFIPYFDSADGAKRMGIYQTGQQTPGNNPDLMYATGGVPEPTAIVLSNLPSPPASMIHGYVFSAVFGGGDSSLYRDGRRAGGFSVGPGTLGGVTIGWSNFSDRPHRMAEFLIASGRVSDQIRRGIEAGLARTYGFAF